MNIQKLILTFFLVLPAFLPAQVFDKDSVFILEKKTLDLGKTISGKNKNAFKGFTWRISTGLMNRTLSEFSNYNNSAAVVPLSMEFGYKFYFFELGFRHSRSGPALGTDYPSSGPLRTTTIASFRLPVNVGIHTNTGVATLHIPIGKIPFFFNFGLGKSDFTFSDKLITKDYYIDGSYAYVVNNNTFTGGLTRKKPLTTTFGVGFSKGPFFGGMEWIRMREKRDNNRASGKEQYHSMFAGLQMTTAKPKNKSSNPISGKKHVQIGLSKLVMVAPRRHSGSGGGWSADLSVKMNKRIQVAASFQFIQKRYGFDQLIPDQNTVDPVFIPFANTGGAQKRHLLYTGYALNPQQLFRIFTYAGLGYYQNKDFEEKINVKRSFGAVIGSGFQYKYIHSQLLFHKTFNKFPLIMEWNLGGRILF